MRPTSARTSCYGDARGDELPEQLCTAEGRRAALREAKRRLAERKAGAPPEDQARSTGESPEVELDPAAVRDLQLAVGATGRARRRRELETPARARAAGRSRAIATTDCWRRPGGWRRTCRSRSPPTDAYERLGDSEGSTRYRNSRRSPGGADEPV